MTYSLNACEKRPRCGLRISGTESLVSGRSWRVRNYAWDGQPVKAEEFAPTVSLTQLFYVERFEEHLLASKEVWQQGEHVYKSASYRDALKITTALVLCVT